MDVRPNNLLSFFFIFRKQKQIHVYFEELEPGLIVSIIVIDDHNVTGLLMLALCMIRRRGRGKMSEQGNR